MTGEKKGFASIGNKFKLLSQKFENNFKVILSDVRFGNPKF